MKLPVCRGHIHATSLVILSATRELPKGGRVGATAGGHGGRLAAAVVLMDSRQQSIEPVAGDVSEFLRDERDVVQRLALHRQAVPVALPGQGTDDLPSEHPTD